MKQTIADAYDDIKAGRIASGKLKLQELCRKSFSATGDNSHVEKIKRALQFVDVNINSTLAGLEDILKSK